MKGKLVVTGMVVAVALWVFAMLSSVESACQPGEPCWDSYSATATASAPSPYPGPYPGPDVVEPLCESGQSGTYCTGHFEVYMSVVRVDEKPWTWRDVDPSCHWTDISQPPPACWCIPTPTEPPDYVPMGCDREW